MKKLNLRKFIKNLKITLIVVGLFLVSQLTLIGLYTVGGWDLMFITSMIVTFGSAIIIPRMLLN